MSVFTFTLLPSGLYTFLLMIIRTFAPSDLPELLSVQAKSLPGESWHGEDYLHLSQQTGGLVLVAERPDVLPARLVGFAAMRQALDHAELLNLAVDPAHRRSGAGRALLVESCNRVRQTGASSIFLEVRPSNQSALHLYYSAGFTMHSIRKNYYTQPVEDAYVLALRQPAS
ncbi:MAG: ribosomal protein S18-alanine N-acetyltransferase [Terriglobia bacterium]